MPTKHYVKIKWERRVPLIERGVASVLVDDPADQEQIKNAVEARVFYEFLPLERETPNNYNMDWKVTEE